MQKPKLVKPKEKKRAPCMITELQLKCMICFYILVQFITKRKGIPEKINEKASPRQRKTTTERRGGPET